MNYFSHITRRQHSDDLLTELRKHQIPLPLRLYIIKIFEGKTVAPMMKMAANTNKDWAATGVMDIHDIAQEHYYALLRAYNRVDWSRIEEVENKGGALWAYLHKSIKFDVRKAINKQKDGINVPVNKIWEEADRRGYEFGIPTFYTQTFAPDYMAETFGENEDQRPYEIEQLNEELHKILGKYLTPQEKSIIEMSFGINEERDKPKTGKAIAELFSISRQTINLIKKKAMEKLQAIPKRELNYLREFLQ